jgi:uncharacterized protein YjeT (DUF2065 family)
MRNAMWILIGVSLAANGLFMLFAPLTWYGMVPGVVETGPFNPHFVRDIGCAYLVAGGGLLWLLADQRAWPAAMASGVFQALHAATHVWDFALGRIELAHFASDLVLVILPAVLVLRLAWRRRNPRPT